MAIKELLELQVNMLDIEIREKKQSLIDRLDSLEKTLAHDRKRLEDTLDDSRKVYINESGILQRQGQMIDSSCMELVTKAKHLMALHKITTDSEGDDDG